MSQAHHGEEVLRFFRVKSPLSFLGGLSKGGCHVVLGLAERWASPHLDIESQDASTEGIL